LTVAPDAALLQVNATVAETELFAAGLVMLTGAAACAKRRPEQKINIKDSPTEIFRARLSSFCICVVSEL